MVAQLLRYAANLVEGEPVDVQRRKLRARVGRHVPAGDVDRVWRHLAEVVGVATEADASGARPGAEVMWDQIRRAFEDFVAAECRTQPLVLVLEDLH